MGRKELADADALDTDRAAWEGMGGMDWEPYDPRLSVFLQTVRTMFRNHQEISEIESCAVLVADAMDGPEKNTLLEVAKNHFLPDRCYLHTEPIDNRRSSDIPSELTAQTLSVFFRHEGGEALRSHLRREIGEDGWKEMERTEMHRIMEHDVYHGSTAG